MSSSFCMKNGTIMKIVDTAPEILSFFKVSIRKLMNSKGKDKATITIWTENVI